MNSDISVMQVINEAIHELEKREEVLKTQLEAIHEQRIDNLDNLIVLRDIKRMLEKEVVSTPMSGPTPWEEGDGERYDFSSSGYRKLKTDYLNGKSGGTRKSYYPVGYSKAPYDIEAKAEGVKDE